MLFDLRGKGRRNTVRVIYLGLALLMGGGLVLFGIGGNTSGGLLDAVKGGGSGSSDNTFEKRVANLEKKVKTNPSDFKSWAELARARAQEASVAGENYDQSTASFTPKGLAKLREAAAAWEKYLALDPPKPDPDVANIMVQAFGPSGLNELEKAVSAMEIVVDQRRPQTYQLFAQLAQLAYLAGQTRKGDLAADKAIELAPKDQKEQVKSTMESIKTQAAQAAVQDASQAPVPATTTP
jgi:tetratricopeptide (TPR) repeat protein